MTQKDRQKVDSLSLGRRERKGGSIGSNLMRNLSVSSRGTMREEKCDSRVSISKNVASFINESAISDDRCCSHVRMVR